MPELWGIDLWRWIAGLLGLACGVLVHRPRWFVGEPMRSSRRTFWRGVQHDPPVWRWRRRRSYFATMGLGWGALTAAALGSPLFIVMGLIGFGPLMHLCHGSRPGSTTGAGTARSDQER